MRFQINPIILFCLVLLIAIGCKKESDFDKIPLRIKKITNSRDLENPVIFEYDSLGLLIKKSHSVFYTVIEYDKNRQPIKFIDYDTRESSSAPMFISTLTWTKDGFELIWHGWIKYIYEINSENQIISNISYSKPIGSPSYNTMYTMNISWSGKTSLKTVLKTPSIDDNLNGWYENYKYSSNYSQFKGINIATLAYNPFSYWYQFQPDYCIIEYSNITYTANITYEFNEQNFPIRADIKTITSNGMTEDIYELYEYEPI